ncbi:MAG: hypothetical protein E6Q24_15270 [Chitinophagaceae bacterium]|nr:MAG: hypothetical protein E6Q24_15270 [Chitinophagaceae bacterium]
MAGNVLSWARALQMGYEPRLYHYQPGDVPMSEVDAVLDFKVWAKKVMGINCYFTQASTGKKFQLTVYLNKGKGNYRLTNGEVDFSQCPCGVLYRLRIGIIQDRVLFNDAWLGAMPAGNNSGRSRGNGVFGNG